MSRYPSRPLRARLLSGATLLLWMAQGCSSDTALVREILDPVTSVTLSLSQTPLVFYRDVPGRAAFARDFVHMAPLEVNRSGDYRYYVWLCMWNTMQSAPGDQPRDGFESVVVFADGEPLSLEIAGWAEDAIGASEPVYLKPVASAAYAYYEVTLDQLRLIAEAREIRLQSTGSKRYSYEPWDDQDRAKAGLIEFLDDSVY